MKDFSRSTMSPHGRACCGLFPLGWGFALRAAAWLLAVAAGPGLLPAQTYTFTTLAGNPGHGSCDGTNRAARFFDPGALALDTAGNLYLGELGNPTIRKLTPAGTNWVVTTLAGQPGVSGTNDGVGGSAHLSSCSGIAVDTNGIVYFSDTANRTIRKIAPDGTVTTLAGTPKVVGTADGLGSQAQFGAPCGLTLDRSGNLYVTDFPNYTIRKVTPSGLVTTIAGTPGVQGTNDGVGSAAQFAAPQQIAIDSAGNLFVTEDNSRTIRKLTPSGNSWQVSTFAGQPNVPGSNDGPITNALFDTPFGLAVDLLGNLYIGDGSDIRLISASGTVTTIAGSSGTSGNVDGTNGNARFNFVESLVVDAGGNLYAADTSNHSIRQISPSGTNWVVTTMAGGLGGSGGSDGWGSAARFNVPNSLVLDAAGNIYVADDANHVIRRVTPGGLVTTLAGSPGHVGSQDGTNTAALFDRPEGIAIDAATNLYVADQLNFTIRKVSPVGTDWVVTTIAGKPHFAGTNDGIGSAARFSNPSDVAVDPQGNLFVCDYNNQTIRKLTASGTDWVVSTFAGYPGQHGTNDGVGTSARFYNPYDIVVDGLGNMYVSDTYNQAVRKITPGGVVTTLAGHVGVAGSADGANGAASFRFPNAIAVDTQGNLYVADSSNYTIRKITPSGSDWIVTTIGGSPQVAGVADGPGSGARFFFPYGVAVDGSGNVYVADGSNHTIRKGIPSGQIGPLTLQPWKVVPGRFGIAIMGPPGLTAALDSSPDFTHWQPVGSYYLDAGTGYCVPPIPAATHQFYRARVP